MVAAPNALARRRLCALANAPRVERHALLWARKMSMAMPFVLPPFNGYENGAYVPVLDAHNLFAEYPIPRPFRSAGFERTALFSLAPLLPTGKKTVGLVGGLAAEH